MGYTKQEIIESLEKGIKDMPTLYKTDKKHNPYINYKEKVEGHPCYDVIAEYLLENHIENLLGSIPEKKRTLVYRQESHFIEGEKKEKILAHSLQKTTFNDIGEILDYEIPLRIDDNDGDVGDIDMLTYNCDKKQYSIIELKLKWNEDSLLHAILQICTYYRQVNKEKLFAEYKKHSDKDIQKVVFIFKGSRQYEDLQSKKMQKLAKLLDVKILILDAKFAEI
jgi:hypothetical protein